MEMLRLHAGDGSDAGGVSLLIRAVGYAPKVSMDTGIAKFVGWYREYHDV